jgi:PQQ-dependent catabolism-associated CXXCW motif protein
MIKLAVRIALVMVTFAIADARAAEMLEAEVLEPDGYRLEEYRAPTPATLRGAKAIGTQEAEKIWRSHSASFIDVLPRPPRPRNLPEGTLWRDKPRSNIPDSIWLPDTGYGELAPAMANYFSRGLEKATGGDHARLLVLYCLMDCWMSWNAAKRALTLGYSNVAWYREGTDGWLAAGLPLTDATPEPRPAE